MDYDASIEDWRKMRLYISNDDFRTIIDLESTLFLNFFQCGNPEENFPSTAFAAGISISEDRGMAARNIEDEGEQVAIDGYIPEDVLIRLSPVCVQLEGGNYLSHRITSNIVQLGEGL